MIKMRVKADFRALDKKERDVKRNANACAREAAELLESTIRRNWSVEVPSTWGNPPAVRTHNLDTSIMIEQQGRDVLGRFAGKDAEIYHVTVDTEKGIDPDGRGQYAAVLDDEEGRFNRPFMDRAADEVAKALGFIFRKVYR